MASVKAAQDVELMSSLSQVESQQKSNQGRRAVSTEVEEVNLSSNDNQEYQLPESYTLDEGIQYDSMYDSESASILIDLIDERIAELKKELWPKKGEQALLWLGGIFSSIGSGGQGDFSYIQDQIRESKEGLDALKQELQYLQQQRVKLEAVKALKPYEDLLETDEYENFKSTYSSENSGLDLERFRACGYNISEYYNSIASEANLNGEQVNLEDVDLMTAAEFVISEFQGDKKNYDMFKEQGLRPEDLREMYPEFGDQLYDFFYMNEDQRMMYHYIFKTKGQDEANDYLDLLADQINQARGVEEFYEFLSDVDLSDEGAIEDKLSNYFIVSQQGFEDEVQQWAEGLYNAFSNNKVLSSNEYAQMYILEFLQHSDGVNEKLKSMLNLTKTYQFSSTLGNMAPSMLLSAYTGFLLTPVAGSTTAANVGKLLGQLSMGISAGGNAKHNALVNGHGVIESTLYGMLTGTSEAMLEKYIGTIPGLSETAGFSIKNMVLEGLEEGVQEWIGEGLNSVVLNEYVDWSTVPEQAWDAFLMGALMSGVLNGPDGVVKLYASGKNITIKVNEIIEYKNQHPDATATEILKSIAGDFVVEAATPNMNETNTTLSGADEQRAEQFAARQKNTSSDSKTTVSSTSSYTDSSWGKNAAGIETAINNYYDGKDGILKNVVENVISNEFLPNDVLEEASSTNNIGVIKEFLMNRNDGSGFRSLTEIEYNSLLEYFNKLNGVDSKGNIIDPSSYTDIAIELFNQSFMQNISTDSIWGKGAKGIEYAFSDHYSGESSIYSDVINDLIQKGFITEEIIKKSIMDDGASLKEFLMNRSSDSAYRSLTEAEYQSFLEFFNKMNGIDSEGNVLTDAQIKQAESDILNDVKSHSKVSEYYKKHAELYSEYESLWDEKNALYEQGKTNTSEYKSLENRMSTLEQEMSSYETKIVGLTAPMATNSCLEMLQPSVDYSVGVHMIGYSAAHDVLGDANNVVQSFFDSGINQSDSHGGVLQNVSIYGSENVEANMNSILEKTYKFQISNTYDGGVVVAIPSTMLNESGERVFIGDYPSGLASVARDQVTINNPINNFVSKTKNLPPEFIVGIVSEVDGEAVFTKNPNFISELSPEEQINVYKRLVDSGLDISTPSYVSYN